MFNLLPPPLKRQDAFCIKNVNVKYDNELDYLGMGNEMNFGEMSNGMNFGEMSNELNFDEMSNGMNFGEMSNGMNFGEMSNEMSNELNFDEIIFRGIPNLEITSFPKRSSSFETRKIIKKNKVPSIRRIYSI